MEREGLGLGTKERFGAAGGLPVCRHSSQVDGWMDGWIDGQMDGWIWSHGKHRAGSFCRILLLCGVS